MRSRGTSIRTKVVALLLSLVALWMFAAWVTLRDGFNLLGVQMLNTKVYAPSEPLLQELQVERRLTQAYLSDPGPAQRAALEAEHRTTAELTSAFTTSVRHWQVDVAGNDTLGRHLDQSVAQLEALAQVRSAVLARGVDRVSAADAYTRAIGSIFQVYEVTGSLDDKELAAEAAALIQLNRVRELISQQDALLSGLFGSGRMSGSEYARYTALVGAERFLGDETRLKLSAADQRRYQQLVESDAFKRLRSVQDSIIRDGRPVTQLPLSRDEWRGTVDPALTGVNDAVVAGGEDLVDRATTVAAMVVLRLVLATGLGLLAVVASIIISVTTARALLRQLERLREAAFRLANERLPGVVERLGHGEEVDVAKEAPPLEFGDDEIGQVGKAFNAVQETAIRTAVEQAELRRNVREVFLSLARRTQALVHRQLTLLDAMERREHDAEELEDLFRVDHLATRMRRNAENLIVLSGSTPGRAWRRNVPMVDVVRGAVAEVEDYTRVNVLPLGPVSLTGRAVGDVIHLLAELIENGLSFSPPHTTVEVRGQMVANGFAIEIEDRGLGMSEEDLAAANHRIVDQSELNLANASRLGLYVVSRLTERHGVRVQLRESAYGGTTAVVLIPADLVTADDADPSTSGGFPAGAPSSPAPGATAPGPAERPVPAPVALAEPQAAPRPQSAPDAADALPTRTRGRGLPTTAPAEERLPTRTRGASAQPALDGPTFPTGLPVAAGRPAADAATPAEAGTGPAAAQAAPADGAAEAGTGATAGSGPARTARPEQARTGSGLPVRVRQASIVPELRDEPAADDHDDDTVRPPEQVRRMMSSYQTGTRRGRTDAARLLGGAGGGRPESGEEAEAGEGPDVGDQQAT
ncbi:nitrate- and nitrite sensing domain-containing protein [Micromonospora sp. URMC 106]|uniref:sensor histidine kinase n=1 Tax=Micromonospora sp. URMC 106 TaxID=3423408 RepID=UPI003F1E27BD